MVKDKLASDDDERRANDEVQKFTDRFIFDVDKLVTGKEQELIVL